MRGFLIWSAAILFCAATASAEVLKLDLGTTNSPVWPGFTRVTETNPMLHSTNKLVSFWRKTPDDLAGDGVVAVRGGPSSPKPESPNLDYSVHPTGVLDEGAVIGKGAKIWHFRHVMNGAQIGERCVLAQNVNVVGGTRLGNNVAIYVPEIEDDVFLGSSCVLTNVTKPRSQITRHSLYERTVIPRGATVGANTTIVGGVTLGSYSLIAAGAAAAKDMPDYALVVGKPARQQGWMSRHGHPLPPGPNGEMICPESGFRYQEAVPGALRCLALDEEVALPAELSRGSKSYDSLRRQDAAHRSSCTGLVVLATSGTQ